MGGGWFIKGCWCLRYVDESVMCECDYLINFVVLLDIFGIFFVSKYGL